MPDYYSIEAFGDDSESFDIFNGSIVSESYDSDYDPYY